MSPARPGPRRSDCPRQHTGLHRHGMVGTQSGRIVRKWPGSSTNGPVRAQTARTVRKRTGLSAIVQDGIPSTPGRGCSCRLPRAMGAIRPAETAPGFARGGERSDDGEHSRNEPFDRTRRRAAVPTSRDSDGADVGAGRSVRPLPAGRGSFARPLACPACPELRRRVTSLTVGAHLTPPVWYQRAIRPLAETPPLLHTVRPGHYSVVKKLGAWPDQRTGAQKLHLSTITDRLPALRAQTALPGGSPQRQRLGQPGQPVRFGAESFFILCGSHTSRAHNCARKTFGCSRQRRTAVRGLALWD